MFILISESRGVEFASHSKAKCKDEMARLKRDDKENGYDLEKYWIDEVDDDGTYQEGLQ